MCKYDYYRQHRLAALPTTWDNNPHISKENPIHSLSILSCNIMVQFGFSSIWQRPQPLIQLELVKVVARGYQIVSMICISGRNARKL